MLKGRYLNPKYARRQKHRRRAVIVTMALVLAVACAGAICRVDNTIRSTMLPAAPPVAAIERQRLREYRVVLFGKEYSLSTEWLHSLGYQLGVVLRTPPAPVRFCWQAGAYLTRRLPRNVRDNPRAHTEL